MNFICKDAGNIYRLLLSEGFKDEYAQYITAQAAHETGNFTSDIYKYNFNPFGMKYVFQDPALGEKNGYAYYHDFSYAVKDYRRLWKTYGIVLFAKVDDFVKLLKQKGYFTAPEKEYLRGVKHFLALYFPGGTLHKDLVIHGAGGVW